jgi:hypothetical protein
MTRATMRLALDALDTCDAHLEVSGMNYGYYFNQEAVHNAVKALTVALAQPEPEPVAWEYGGEFYDRTSLLLNASGREQGKPLCYAAPSSRITYRNPADDVALKRSFAAMESGIVAELRKELAVMEADRDYWQECYWCIT